MNVNFEAITVLIVAILVIVVPSPKTSVNE